MLVLSPDRPETNVTVVGLRSKFKLGGSIHLRCDVDSNPEHSAIKWHNGSGQIKQGGRFQISPDQSQLTITRLTGSDNGNVWCSAVNRVGEGEIFVTYGIVVEGTPFTILYMKYQLSSHGLRGLGGGGGI